ncbi:hypothetical protein [Streptomyces rubiginosohelvolus]|uniref:hypothetical protein n=1 Tax=Streptomyces rubiginosohelvolus TaxID=67362 RepID=UPI003821ECDF
MPDTSPTTPDRPADQLHAAVWVDGDPLMEAMAAAVYDQCDKHPEVSVTIDDPRNIAAVAAAVARQLLGTSTGEEPAAALEPQDHPGVDLFAALQHAGYDVDEANRRMYAYARMVLRQEKATAAPPAPADRAAHYREAANGLAALGPLDNLVSAPAAWTEAIETLRRMADQIADDDRSRLAGEAAAGARCPRCDEDLTTYTDDDRVYRKGDTRPYCSGECVVFAWRKRLPIPRWAADNGEAAAGAAAGAHQTEQAQPVAEPEPVVCEGFVWIGQSFAHCDRCGQPAWDHDGEEVAAEGAGPFDTGRTIRPWKPGQADAIRAKWAPATPAAPAAPEETP